MRVSGHIVIKTAFLKIILSEIIIITQSECNAVTLRSIFFIGHMDTFHIYESFNCFRLSQTDPRDTLKKRHGLL